MDIMLSWLMVSARVTEHKMWRQMHVASISTSVKEDAVFGRFMVLLNCEVNPCNQPGNKASAMASLQWARQGWLSCVTQVRIGSAEHPAVSLSIFACCTIAQVIATRVVRNAADCASVLSLV